MSIRPHSGREREQNRKRGRNGRLRAKRGDLNDGCAYSLQDVCMPRTPTRPHTTSCCFAVPPRRPFRPCPKAKKGENNIASALDKLDGFACFLCCYICVPFFVLGIDSWAPARRHCCGVSRTLPGSLVRRKQERVCEGAEEEEEEERRDRGGRGSE